MFYGCTGLTSVVINDSAAITSIGTNAFSGCTALNSLKKKSATSPEETIDYKIIIPEGVKTIEQGAFNNCAALPSVSIPGSVTSLEKVAFNGCTGLKSLRLEDGSAVLYLGSTYSSSSSGTKKGLFRDCPLENLYVGRNLSYTNYDTSYTYSSNPSYYGYSAFANITSLASVTISVPSGVTSFTIGKYAFKGCTGITSAIFTNTIGNTPIGVWRSSTSSNSGGTVVDVSDEASAATVLKNMGENYLYWKNQ